MTLRRSARCEGMTSRTLLAPAALAIALGTAGQAHAADFSTRFLDQAAGTGLAVSRNTSGGQVRVDALWNGVLTRRDDIVPSGQVAWSEIRVTATSRKGDECHSGTYRKALGPTLGDSLAVARATLRFTRKR